MHNGITAIEYTLGEEALSLAVLAQGVLLDSPPTQLAALGFDTCRISRRSSPALAQDCAERLLREHAIEPESVDLLIYASPLTCNHFIPQRVGLMANFTYPASALHEALGLVNANALELHTRYRSPEMLKDLALRAGFHDARVRMDGLGIQSLLQADW